MAMAEVRGPRLVALLDLIDRAGIADEYGVTKTAVGLWTQRPGFPEPIHAGRYHLYLMSEVRAWVAANRRPRGRRDAHGTAASYQAGCRCEPCVKANARQCKRQRIERGRRVAVDPSLARHGAAATYRDYGCRCDPCTAANSAACKAYKRRKAG